MSRLLSFAVLSLSLACERRVPITEEHTPAAQARAAEKALDIKQAQHLPGARDKATAQPLPALAWDTAKAPSAQQRQDLRAFFTRLDAKSFQDHFRAAPPSESDAAASREALRQRPFLLELPVELGSRRNGVYLENEPSKPAAFRWVWPVDVGDQIFLVRHKPRVNAGTGTKQLRKAHTWLMDLPDDPALLKEIQADPSGLKFRALWQPRGARTDRYPVLVVRVMAWQLRFGQRVLHTETDDR